MSEARPLRSMEYVPGAGLRCVGAAVSGMDGGQPLCAVCHQADQQDTIQPRSDGPRIQRRLALARVRDKFTVGDDCWEWTASTHEFGYGRIRIQRVEFVAHRLVYEILVGPIPDGLHIDHLCRNPRCVRPDHLEPVTKAENERRGLIGILNTECVNGHPWTEESTYYRPDNGTRQCRICQLDRSRRNYSPARRRATYDPAARRERYLRQKTDLATQTGAS